MTCKRMYSRDIADDMNVLVSFVGVQYAKGNSEHGLADVLYRPACHPREDVYLLRAWFSRSSRRTVTRNS